MLQILLPFCVLFILWALVTGSRVAGFFLALLTFPILAFIALMVG